MNKEYLKELLITYRTYTNQLLAIIIPTIIGLLGIIETDNIDSLIFTIGSILSVILIVVFIIINILIRKLHKKLK